MFRQSITRPRLLMLLILYFVISAAFSGFEATFALFSARRFGFTTATIGYLFAFIGVVLALVQGVLVGRVVKRVKEHHLIPAAVAIIGISIAALPFAYNVPALLLVVGTLALGMGLNSPAMSSMVSRLSNEHQQGGVLGVAQSMASLGRIVGPVWGGFLFDRFGMSFPYLSGAVIMAVAFGVSVAVLRSE